MLRSRIVIDLPSVETDRRRNPIEWLRSLFGAQLDLGSGREELTVGAAWLVEGLVEGFAHLGITDVVAFLVDKQAVYLDAKDVPDDLPMIVHAAESAGVLDRTFREMHLALAHRSETLHTTIECTVKNGVLLGQAEMSIVLLGQIPEQGRRGAAVDPALRELDVLTERIANEMNSVLRGARVTSEAASVSGD